MSGTPSLNIGFDNDEMLALAFTRVLVERNFTIDMTTEYSTKLEGAPNLSALNIIYHKLPYKVDTYAGSLVVDFRTAVAKVYYGRGTVHCYVLAATVEDARAASDAVREVFPVREEEITDDSVYVTFWTLGSRGPQNYTRRIVAPGWLDITGNYNRDTQPALHTLMGSTPDSLAVGKLILWHGPPGTGKSYALRALGRAWSKWASLHYIVDPENFFGANAGYMTDVLLQPQDDEEKWRVLVLEDTGELLTKDAKLREGQALSRLLNLTDGMIGQGLKVLVLITTNEDVGQFHQAVTRPGRTVANIKFSPMSKEERIAWLAGRNAPASVVLAGADSLAELYSAVASTHQIVNTTTNKKVGFSV